MKMKKSIDLLQGKGEIDWITANGQHIPVGEKESKEEAVKKFVESHENKQNDKQNSEGMPKFERNKFPPDEEPEELRKETIQKLVQILNKVTKIKLQDLVKLMKSFEPVELKIYDKKIAAAFDKYSANKNIYTRGNSTHKGFIFKLDNMKDLPKFIKDSQYTHSKDELGKDSKQHKGVKEWHYFKKEIQIGNEKYDVIINIRDKGNKQYIYEVIFK